MANLISLPRKFFSQVRKNGFSAALDQTLRYLYGNWCKLYSSSKVTNIYETTSLPRFYGMPKPIKYIFDLPPSHFLRHRVDTHAKAKFIKEIYNLRPWYHDFKELGIQTNFPPEKRWKFFGSKVRGIRHSAEQQPRKESVIKPYIEKSLNLLSGNPAPQILDLFCADGYYGIQAKKLCPQAVLTGVDMNKYDIIRAKSMAKHLKFDDAEFIADDVINYVNNCERSFDIIVNVGGLYHLSDPIKLLKSLRVILGSYLIIQSAITVEHNKPDYFKSPRPGYTYGSWFTHARLERWLQELGYYIIDSCTNERSGENLGKVGASYFLITLNEKIDSVKINI